MRSLLARSRQQHRPAEAGGSSTPAAHAHSRQACTAACHFAEAVVPCRAAVLRPARPCAPLSMSGGPRQAAAMIQAMARGRAARARYRRLRAAAVVLQAAWRRAAQRARFLRLRAAALRLQAAARGARARAEACARRRAIMRIQVPAQHFVRLLSPSGMACEPAFVVHTGGRHCIARTPEWAGPCCRLLRRHCCAPSAPHLQILHTLVVTATNAIGGSHLTGRPANQPGPGLRLSVPDPSLFTRRPTHREGGGRSARVSLPVRAARVARLARPAAAAPPAGGRGAAGGGARVGGAAAGAQATPSEASTAQQGSSPPCHALAVRSRYQETGTSGVPLRALTQCRAPREAS
jgi:hypothetical protein